MKKKTASYISITEDGKTEYYAVNRKARRFSKKMGLQNRVKGEPLSRIDGLLWMGGEQYTPQQYEWPKKKY